MQFFVGVVAVTHFSNELNLIYQMENKSRWDSVDYGFVTTDTILKIKEMHYFRWFAIQSVCFDGCMIFMKPNICAVLFVHCFSHASP